MYDWVLSEVDATFLLCYFCLNGENCAFPFSLFCNKTIVLGPREHKAAVMRIHYQIINKCANTSISLQVFVLYSSDNPLWGSMRKHRSISPGIWKITEMSTQVSENAALTEWESRGHKTKRGEENKRTERKQKRLSQ